MWNYFCILSPLKESDVNKSKSPPFGIQNFLLEIAMPLIQIYKFNWSLSSDITC